MLQVHLRLDADGGDAEVSGKYLGRFTVVAILARTRGPNDFVSQASANHENAEVDGNSEDSVIDDTTEDYWAGSGSGPDEDESLHNETREALTHEASDHDAVSHASPICFALRVYLLKFTVDVAQEVSSVLADRPAISSCRYIPRAGGTLPPSVRTELILIKADSARGLACLSHLQV